MCIHPWFFSIGRLHLGQGLELASILQFVRLKIEMAIKKYKINILIIPLYLIKVV